MPAITRASPNFLLQGVPPPNPQVSTQSNNWLSKKFPQLRISGNA